MPGTHIRSFTCPDWRTLVLHALGTTSVVAVILGVKLHGA